MKIKYIYIGTAVILLAIVCVISAFYFKANSADSTNDKRFETLEKEALTANQDLQSKYAYFGADKIPDSLIHLLDSLKINNCLVYRFTQLNCNTCVEMEMPKLKKLAKKTGKDKIILLVSFSSTKELKIISNKYKIDFQMYNIDLDAINYLPIEELNVPYCYIRKEKNIHSVFIPNKALPELSFAYYDRVAESFR